ncbi:MAG: hypothetical protein GY696_06470 [Gammaproteobacteria bacterium]|nr:hypothetical protein [Gammaproteobacteria bacterium]
MTQKPDDESGVGPDSGETSWGPKLFAGAMVALLGFFYWLLIYSGGVTMHHG